MSKNNIYPGGRTPAWPAGRKLRARIRRRAHELGLLAYQRNLIAILQDLNDGKLDPSLIESWDPPKGEHVMQPPILRFTDGTKVADSKRAPAVPPPATKCPLTPSPDAPSPIAKAK